MTSFPNRERFAGKQDLFQFIGLNSGQTPTISEILYSGEILDLLELGLVKEFVFKLKIKERLIYKCFSWMACNCQLLVSHTAKNDCFYGWLTIGHQFFLLNMVQRLSFGTETWFSPSSVHVQFQTTPGLELFQPWVNPVQLIWFLTRLDPFFVRPQFGHNFVLVQSGIAHGLGVDFSCIVH